MSEQSVVRHPQLSPNEDIRPFTLSNHLEIAYQLRALINRRELVSVYFNQGEQFFLTTLLDVNAEAREFTFDPGSDETSNQRLLTSRRIIFVAAPEGIKTQFVCGPAREASDAQGRVLVCPFPPDLIKLQRREYFRVETPVVTPLMCRIEQPDNLKLALHDISLGGLSLLASAQKPEFEKMSLLTDCRVDLPGFGAFVFDLEVRNLRALVQKNGAQSLLVGCRFINLNGKAQNLLQRYMIQLERERRALSA